MRISKSYLLALCLSFLALCSIEAEAQTSRVDRYTVTAFDAEWDSLRTGVATTIAYDGGPNEGTYTIPLPFDFIYDGVIYEAGMPLKVSANGAMSFANISFPPQQLIGDPSFPAVIAPFNGDLKQGSDVRAGVADTSGLYQVNGESPTRVLTIEYRGFHLRGGGSGTGQVDTLASMQVKLYESTGVIEFIYRDHGLDLPTKFAGRMCVGLNGQVLPTFSSKIYVQDTKVIPMNDIRWTPGTASVRDEEVAELKLFPAPVRDQLHIELPPGRTIQSIEVIDAVGRVQPLGPAPSGLYDVSSLGSGKYLVRVTTDRGSMIKSMTVTR